MRLCYLAGPIDAVSQGDATGWREEATEKLNGFGIATFSPAHAFTLPDGSPPSTHASQIIQRVNDEAVRVCDIVLANLEGKSFGTPIECMDAKKAGADVFVFGLSENSIYRHHFSYQRTMAAALSEIEQWAIEQARIAAMPPTELGGFLDD